MRNYFTTLVLLLFGLALSSCGLSLPKRLIVQTETTLAISLGNAKDVKAVQDLLDYADINKIAEKFDVKDAKPYYYTAAGWNIPLPDVNDAFKNQTPTDNTNALNAGEARVMMIHMPLSRMKLDFEDYMKHDIEMPQLSFPSGNAQGGQSPIDLPAVNVPLGDMAKWVSTMAVNDDGSVSSNAQWTTITIKGAAVLQSNLTMKAEDIGIIDSNNSNNNDNYETGRASADGRDLVFTATGETALTMTTTAEIALYFRLTGNAAVRGTYDIELDLKWKSAVINPGGQGKLEDSITLSLSGLKELVEDYEFISAPVYLYVAGTGGGSNTPHLTVKSGTRTLVDDDVAGDVDVKTEYTFLEDANKTGYYAGSIVASNAGNFNIKDALNEAKDLTLDYIVDLGQNGRTITPSSQSQDISIDMMLFLPYTFNLKVGAGNASKMENIGGKNYFLLHSEDNKNDIFGRGSGNNMQFSEIKSVLITGTNLKNTVIKNDIYARIKSGAALDKLVLIEDNFAIALTGGEVDAPFAPTIYAYIEAGQDSRLTLKPWVAGQADEFDIELDAEANGVITYETEL